MPALDGVRGIAVLAVFLFHYGGGATSPNILLRAVGTIKQFGWSGVDLFFVLSGFLITGILFDTRNEKGYFSKFYARRALRLFPLLLGITLILIALTPLLHLQWRIGHIAYLFYGANVISYFDPTLNGVPPYFGLAHFWSLAVEEQFYLIWPLIIYLIPERERLIRVCIAIIIGALFLRIALYESRIVVTEFLFMETPCRMDSFAIGGLLALLLRREKSNLSYWLPRWMLGTGISIVAIIMAFAHSFEGTSPMMSTVGLTFVAMIAGSFILYALREGSWINRICMISFLRVCGEYSYGIYIYHGLLRPILQPQLPYYVNKFHSMMLGGVLFVGVSFSIIFLISATSYTFYEKPLMKLKTLFSYHARVKVLEL
jgi:peptidoglycan/LPS O-acetylase OafA/YrhL